MHSRSYYERKREQRKQVYKTYDGYPLATCILHFFNVFSTAASMALFFGGLMIVYDSHYFREAILGIIMMIVCILPVFIPIIVDKIIQKYIN